MHLNPECLSFALLISDLGSIACGANILGMKQATLSRKLTALESRLGVRLFNRSTRGAVPTVSGAGFLNQARRIVADSATAPTNDRFGEALQLAGTTDMGAKQPSTARFLGRFPPFAYHRPRSYPVTQSLTLASEFPVAGTASWVPVGMARAVMPARGCFSVRCSARK